MVRFIIVIMSEKTAPAAETVVSVPTVSEKKRPEKPDEAAFEAAKEKAKKEHKVAQDKFVCGPPIHYSWLQLVPIRHQAVYF